MRRIPLVDCLAASFDFQDATSLCSVRLGRDFEPGGSGVYAWYMTGQPPAIKLSMRIIKLSMRIFEHL